MCVCVCSAPRRTSIIASAGSPLCVRSTAFVTERCTSTPAATARTAVHTADRAPICTPSAISVEPHRPQRLRRRRHTSGRSCDNTTIHKSTNHERENAVATTAPSPRVALGCGITVDRPVAVPDADPAVLYFLALRGGRSCRAACGPSSCDRPPSGLCVQRCQPQHTHSHKLAHTHTHTRTLTPFRVRKARPLPLSPSVSASLVGKNSGGFCILVVDGFRLCVLQ